MHSGTVSTGADDADYTLAFEEPPPESQHSQAGGPILANLRKVAERPGEWGRVATYPGNRSAINLASKLRLGNTARSRPPGIWEFRSGPLGNDSYGVWAKFQPLPPETD